MQKIEGKLRLYGQFVGSWTPRSFLWLGERTGRGVALEGQTKIFAKRV